MSEIISCPGVIENKRNNIFEGSDRGTKITEGKSQILSVSSLTSECFMSYKLQILKYVLYQIYRVPPKILRIIKPGLILKTITKNVKQR